ncbi:MAG TPA: saccharopine dehydrogenase NADP-binding domain-containing protein [Steroidobacteraceae bacterium]|nr:saccharopine dehydrogenase NADP-binding domain-containing protein [Steroidobacteraceae bacterium]
MSSPHRVLILGGYGFFGRMIAEKLARAPGVDLLLAGRDLGKATALAYQLGLRAENARAVDAADPRLSSLLRKLGVHTVIHTAGPFQGQQYHVARAAIEARSHYLDLADGRAFVTGIDALDTAARAAGVCVFSGVSSLPALSAAVIDQHLPHFKRLDSIAIGISSGAKLPGVATLRAVMSYCGKRMRVWENGAWSEAFGWLDRRTFDFPKPVGARLLGRCDVPDLTLLPQRYPGVRTVSFHAGFASDSAHKAVEWLASQVRRGKMKSALPYASVLHRLGRWLEPVLPDRGAMFVRMHGPDDDDRARTLTWQLLAYDNHGPRIPCGPAIALTRKLARGDTPEPGARPCMGVLTVKEILDTLQGLSIRELAPAVPTYVSGI